MTPTSVLPGRVVVASGCGGTGRELAPFASAADVEMVTRTLTLDGSREGSARRVVEAPGGVLTTLSTHNPGLEHFLAIELPPLVRAGVTVHVSISGAGAGEVATLARRLCLAPGVHGLELNLDPPYAHELGLVAAVEPFQAAGVVRTVRTEFGTDRSVVVKVRPEGARLVDVAHACLEAGADALVVGHGLSGCLDDGTPAVLSGAAIRPVVHAALRRLVDAGLGERVIACGGVDSPQAARDYLSAGAYGVQVGSVLLRDPLALASIRRNVEEWRTLAPSDPEFDHDIDSPGGDQ